VAHPGRIRYTERHSLDEQVNVQPDSRRSTKGQLADEPVDGYAVRWYRIRGMGHYYGKYGFDALTHAKSMLISPPDVAIEHLYSPFTEEKNRQLAGMFEY